MSSLTITELVGMSIHSNDSIRPSFDLILTSTAFSACLFTLLVVLFVFSTRESRRRVVFQLDVLAICLALTLGILIGLACGTAIIDPVNEAWKSFYVTAIAFALYPPLLYDSILLNRLFALYPLGSTPSVTLVKIFVFPFCIKCGRVVALTLFLHDYIKSGDGWYRNPKIVAGWVMETADNLYSVSLFLYNLHILALSIKRDISRYTVGGISERIHQLFSISLANFVFPLFFNITQIFLARTDKQPTTGVMVVVVNNYVTVMGVLCATLWFSGSEWVRTHSQPVRDYRFSCMPNLELAHGPVGKHGSEILVIGRSLAR
ncbi:hypothetical protein EDC04DRAFT_573780 [Pisolithus marmoratus]|nr:hypothetical protein EDC04DRAFT_573780 [Pisolithus marmoratus]